MKDLLVKYWIEGVFLLITAALIICVILNSLLPVIFMAGLFLISIILWQPLFGFCMMVFFMPLENLTLLFPGFTLIKVIGVITFASWLIHLIPGKKIFKLNGFILLLVLYFLWSFLSVVWAVQPEQSLYRIVSMSQLLAMFVLGYNLVDNKKELYLILGSYLLGALFSSCLGIFNSYLYGFTIRADIGNMSNPNFYARVVGLGIVFSGYLIIVSKNKFARLFSLICCTTLPVAVLLSGSRGAWLALLLTPAAALFLCRKYIIKLMRKRIIIISLLIILLFTLTLGPSIISHLPPVIVQRMQTLTCISDQIDVSAGRLDIWSVGLEIVKDNWVWGVGLDNFPYAFTEYLPRVEGIFSDIGLNRDPHSIFLANLAELGIPGFLLFISLLVSMWRMGGRTEKLADSLLSELTVVFLVSAGLTSTDHCSKFFWFGMLIPSIVSRLYYFKDIDRGKSKAKVLFLSPIFPNRFNPNYGIFSFRLVQNLKSTGVPVTVVTPVPFAPPFLWFKKKWMDMGCIPWKECFDGVEIVYPRFFCLPGGRLHYWNILFMYLAVYPVIRTINNAGTFNVIHSYGVLPAGFAGQLIARKLNMVSVSTAIGSDINVLAQKSNRMIALTKSVLENTGQVVAVSKALALKASKLTGINRNVKVIYEGVDGGMFDASRMDRGQLKLKLGFSAGERLILFAGRLVREKGVYELIEAFSRVSGKFPEAVLVFVGTGKEKNALIDLVERKGLHERIVFAGEKPHEELVCWYTASEVVVLLSHYEGVPNVIKEAMSCCRPVIATRTGGIPELVVDGKSGILVEPGNVDEAVKALEKLLRNPELGVNMGIYARELLRQRQLDWKRTAEAYRQVYIQLIGGRNNRNA